MLCVMKRESYTEQREITQLWYDDILKGLPNDITTRLAASSNDVAYTIDEILYKQLYQCIYVYNTFI